MKRLISILGIVAFLIMWLGSMSPEHAAKRNEVFVSPDNVPGWDLTLERGYLSCEKGAFLLLRDKHDNVYAVNGAARGTGEYKDIKQVMKDPDIDWTVLLDYNLCSRSKKSIKEELKSHR